MPLTLATVTTGTITPTETLLLSNLFSVTVESNITNIGGSSVTERGVCYDIVTSPTITTNKVLGGNGIGSFSVTLRYLSPNVTYYVRSYATNSFGTAYGTTKTYKRVVTAPKIEVPISSGFSKTSDLITLVINNNITDNGGAVLLTKGICWATTTNPTILNNNLVDNGVSNTFISQIPNLLPNTTYYIKTYSSNFIGLTYSTVLTYKNTITLPQIITTNTSDYRSITCNGDFSVSGDLSVTEKGFVISTLKNPTIETSLEKSINGYGTSTFNNTFSSLTPNTTYYVKPYIQTVLGITYGTQVTTKTKALTSPKLSKIVINPIYEVGVNNQILYFEVSATITDNGGAPIFEGGIIWAPQWIPNKNDPGQFITSTFPVPTGVTDLQISSGLTIGTVITGKLPSTTAFRNIFTNEFYYDEGYENPINTLLYVSKDGVNGNVFAKVYAKNYVGIGLSSEEYGERTPLSFPTRKEVSTSFVSMVTPTKFSVKSQIKVSPLIIDHGICWSKNYNPTINDNRTNVIISQTEINAILEGNYKICEFNIDNITTTDIFYVRSYVMDNLGTYYSTTCSGFKRFSGNTLNVVKIGDTDWSAYDLDTIYYRNGDIIPQVQDQRELSVMATGAWCYINNDPILGKLYNGYAIIDPRGLAPLGFRIPTNNDWGKLYTELSGVNRYAGGSMKTTGYNDWAFPNWNATNSSGFNASGLPGERINLNLSDVSGVRKPSFWKNLKYNNRIYKNYTSSTTGKTENNIELISKTLTSETDELQTTKFQLNSPFSVRCVKEIPANLPSVTIGTQVWTNKNLDVITYRNGDVIPQVTGTTAWANLTTGAWCWWNNDPIAGAQYGRLYNWYAINDPRGFAPIGWHIPTTAELTTISNYLGGISVAGGKMKSTIGWNNNANGTNTSGFNGIPGASRLINGAFYNFIGIADWWVSNGFSSTDGYIYRLSSEGNSIYLNGHNNKKVGFPIRFIRDL